MATYQVKDREGKTYRVQGPAGATESQVIAAVLAQQQSDEIARLETERDKRRVPIGISEPEPEDTTLLGNIIRGIPAGFIQGLEVAALGAITPLGEEAEVSARDIIRSIADAVKPELANPQEVSAQVFQGVGSFLSLAPALAAGPLAPLAVAGMAASMGVGEASERARAAGASESDKAKAAALGIFPGLLDVIPFARVSKRAAPFLNQLYAKMGTDEIVGIGNKIRRAAITGGVEGAQETAQGIVQNMIEKGVYNPEAGIITKEPFQEGAIGVGAGAIIQISKDVGAGLLEAFVGRRRKGPPIPPTDEEAQATLAAARDAEDQAAALRAAARGDTAAAEAAVLEPALFPTTRAAEEVLFPEGGAPEGPAALRRRERERQRATPPEVIESEAAARLKPIEIGQPEFLSPLIPADDPAIESKVAAKRPAYEEKARRDTEEGQVEPSPFETEVNIRRDIYLDQAGLTPEGEYVLSLEEATTRARIDAEQAQRRAEPPVRDPRQTDLMDVIKTEEFLEDEDAALQEMERQEAGVAAPIPITEELRAESELETIEGRVGTQRQQTTAARRGTILDSVLTDLDTTSRVNTEQRFSQALAAAGIVNTTPTTAESQTIQRATDIIAATQKEALPETEPVPTREPVEPVPTRQEVRAQRAAARQERDIARGEQTRGEIPGLGRQLRTRAEAPPPALPVTAATLAGIPKSTPTYKQLMKLGKEGRDTSDPEVRRLLEAHEERINTRKPSKKNTEQLETIQNLLRGSVLLKPETTTDETGTEQLTFFGTTFPNTKLGARGGRGGVRGAIPTRELPSVAVAEKGAEITPAGLDDIASAITGTPRRKRAGPDTLTAEEKRLTASKIGKETKAKATTKRRTITKRKAGAEDKAEDKAEPKAEVKAKPKTAKLRRVPSITKKALAEEVKALRLMAQRTRTAKLLAEPLRETRAKGGVSVLRPYTELSPTREEAENIEIYTAPSKEGEERISLTTEDNQTIRKLIKTRIKAKRAVEEGEKTAESIVVTQSRDAQTYFSRHQDANDAVEAIVHDYIFSKSYRVGLGENKALRDYLGGTGGVHAKNALEWVRRNLDSKSVEQVKELVAEEKLSFTFLQSRHEKQETKKGEDVEQARKVQANQDLVHAVLMASLASEKRDAEIATARKKGEQEESLIEPEFDALSKVLNLKDIENLLKEDAVVGLDIPVNPVIPKLLFAGRLQDALHALSVTSLSDRVTNIARTLSETVGDTKVEVVNNLKNQAGKRAAGLFDPKTNTIKLDSEIGINAHTILHETTHALTSHTIADKSHPLTKQLTKLFNEVKDQLGSWYGAENVDEFVSEAFGNSEFQQVLAGINPKGSPVSALHRFFNSVTNFIRRKVGWATKPVNLEHEAFNTVLDKTDALIHAMLSPAPDSRYAGEMNLNSTREAARKVLNGIENVQKSFPKATDAYRSKYGAQVRDFFKGGSTAPLAKKVFAMLAPLQALTDVARHFALKSAFELHRTIETMVGRQSEAEAHADGSLQQIIGWFKGNSRGKIDALNRVAYTSTREQMHPNSKQPKDSEKAKIWKDMRKDWSLIGTSGQAVYTRMLKTYEKLFEELRDVIYATISDLKDKDGIPISDDAKKELKNDVFKKIFEKGRIYPYFPLTRKGDFWLEFLGTDPVTGKPDYVFKTFDNDTAREDFVNGLKGKITSEQFKTIRRYQNLDDKGILNTKAPAASFVGQTLQVLRANKVDEATQIEFMRLFIDALPESSFAKSLSKRGNEGAGKSGYREDVLEAFTTKAYSLAAQTQRLKYAPRITAAMEQIEKEYIKIQQDTPEDQKNAKILVDELKKRADFAINPPRDKWAATANRIAFIGTIGFNVSSALVNLSQIPLMMYPILSGRYGWADATAALGSAGRLVTTSGFNRLLPTILKDGSTAKAHAMPSIDNYFKLDADGNYVIREDLLAGMSDRKKAQVKDLKTLVRLASMRGQLTRSLNYDTLGLTSSGRKKSLWDWTSAYSAFMFHQVERFNRQVAMVSTYQLELKRLRKEHGGKLTQEQYEDAANEAIYRALEMNGGAFLATAPRLAQEKLGRVAMMYKGFGLQMHYTMFKTAYHAFKVDFYNTLRKEGFSHAVAKSMSRGAFRELVGIALSSVFLAGVQGLPLFGAAVMAANMFLDDDEEDAETIVRKYIGEGWYKGAVNYATGVNVASRIGLSNLLFRSNPYSRNQSEADIMIQGLGGPAYSVYSQFRRGMEDVIVNGEVQRGVENMLPSAFRNILKVYGRYIPEGGIKSRRGDIIYDDLTTGEVVGQLIGFAPSDYTLIQEKNMSTKQIDRATGIKRTGLLWKLYVTRRLGDTSAYIDTQDEIRKYNALHPTWPISVADMIASAKAHGRVSALMHNGIILSPRMRSVLLAHQNEYWGDD